MRNQKLSSKEVIKRDSARVGVKVTATGRLTVVLNQKEYAMSITDQLDTRLRATKMVKLGMRRGFVGTHPALKLLLGVKSTPLDLRHNSIELDALRKLEDCRMTPKQRVKSI